MINTDFSPVIKRRARISRKVKVAAIYAVFLVMNVSTMGFMINIQAGNTFGVIAFAVGIVLGAVGVVSLADGELTNHR